MLFYLISGMLAADEDGTRPTKRGVNGGTVRRWIGCRLRRSQSTLGVCSNLQSVPVLLKQDRLYSNVSPFRSRLARESLARTDCSCLFNLTPLRCRHFADCEKYRWPVAHATSLTHRLLDSPPSRKIPREYSRILEDPNGAWISLSTLQLAVVFDTTNCKLYGGFSDLH